MTGPSPSQLVQRGAAATEFIVVFPALVFLMFGIIQWGLIYQARSTLDYATLLAARAGAVKNGNETAMRNGLAAGLAPLFASEASDAGTAQALVKARREVSKLNPLNMAKVEILNPTRQALVDFGQAKLDGKAGRELPNDTLNYRNTKPGTASGVSVQDANLLHIRVTYCYRLFVPVVGRMIEAVAHALTPFDHVLQEDGMSDPFGIGQPLVVDATCKRPLTSDPRLQIQSEAVVRMQSPFYEANL